MTTYRTGRHHGVTIVREGDGARCGRPDHDCERGHLVAVVIEGGDEGDQAFAERICALLNGDERMQAVIGELDRYRTAERPGPPHPTCVETTAHAELVAGTRTWMCGQDCLHPPRDPDMDAMIAMQDWGAGERNQPTDPPVQHRPERRGSDSEGYGQCTGCGELWPCAGYRGEWKPCRTTDPVTGYGEHCNGSGRPCPRHGTVT